jgi:CRP/FNR family cyclic AMP-dependent transcriptional regulator
MLPIIDVKEGQIIFEEHQLDRRMFLILEGSVQLFVTRSGHDANLETVNKYGFFGEIEMYKNRPRSMSARALEKTRLAVIKTRIQLEQFISEHPQFSGKMTRLMGQRLADAQLAVS